MARSDIVRRGELFSDKGSRYSWNWEWLEKEYSVTVSEKEGKKGKQTKIMILCYDHCIKKLAAVGKAYCDVCRKEVAYGNKGFTAIKVHCDTSSHKEKIICRSENNHLPGPFRATQIWNELIAHMKKKVELKRRRHKMRVYNNCFTGTDAVDVILHYLLSDKDTFSTDLTREKAVKVCQLLLTKKVFEPVTSRHGNNTKHAFEDTSGKLYCFIETDSSENRENEPPIENDSDDDSLCDETDSHCTESRRGSLLMEPLSEKVGIIHPESKADHKSQASFCSLSSYSSLPSLSDFDSSNDSSGAVTKDVIEEVWREVALAQLTTLIDLTFLDGVLAEDKLSKRQQQHHNLIISNIVAKNWHLPITQSLINLNLVGLEEAEEDGVIQTAIACIECLPKGASLLTENNFQKNDDSTKQQAFELLHKHYSCLAETILPGRFFDLHMAILNLVLQRHDKQALEALRLDMILLPVTAKEELHRLLKFMTAVSLDTSLTLDSSDSNEVVVLRAFSNAIFKHKLLAPNLGSTLVQFMMQHLRKMFTVPYVIREKVSLRLYQIKSGQSLPEYDTTFCDRVSKEEFDRQARDCTQEALVNLMNNILDDTKLTLKEKKQKLKHFQKCYPTLYERHFSGMV